MNSDDLLRCNKWHTAPGFSPTVKYRCVKLPNHSDRCVVLRDGELLPISTYETTRTADYVASEMRSLPTSISDYLARRATV